MYHTDEVKENKGDPNAPPKVHQFKTLLNGQSPFFLLFYISSYQIHGLANASCAGRNWVNGHWCSNLIDLLKALMIMYVNIAAAGHGRCASITVTAFDLLWCDRGCGFSHFKNFGLPLQNKNQLVPTTHKLKVVIPPPQDKYT